MTGTLPLAGIKVLDLSTLLPGPLATLMLAEAGADVIKLERPGRGDEMRTYEPTFGEASANYAILNRGKRAYAVDFKDPAQRDRVLEIAADADIVMEQFRPGVAERLGLSYDAMRERNPRIVYCSISGYGPTGQHASRAGHDLNYLAESGLLGVVTDANGSPNLPVSVLADIAAGTYPAVMNVLLALRMAERTGEGAHLQVSMTHNLQVLAYGYIATHQAAGTWPQPSAELLTGGSPRYQIYPAADGRYIACAALEEKFWQRLVTLVGLDKRFHYYVGQEQAVTAALTDIFASQPSSYWRELLAGEDVCTVVVNTWEEAVEAGHVNINSADRVCVPGDPDLSIPTLTTSVDPTLRIPDNTRAYPSLAPLPDGHVVWA